ncbi:hypothetical protein N7453_002620 [Penicillium expansum]|nr:hypothetical protein N7453_002620 [Penicillium expansum]
MAFINHEPIAIVGIGCRLPGGVMYCVKVGTLCRKFRVTALMQTPCTAMTRQNMVPFETSKGNSWTKSNPSMLNSSVSSQARHPGSTRNSDSCWRLAFMRWKDSGTTLKEVAGSQTSVFVGMFANDYLSIQGGTEQRDNVGPHAGMGTHDCSIANRVSHRLDLRGPSLTLNTACSSSLVALHLAWQSLWAQESTAALVGGVNAILRPESTILMSKAGFLSPDGACKLFDAAGNGYVRSEGVGMVFLKPLSRAIQNKGRIYALGFTVPSLAAQTALLHSIYKQSNTDPAKVRYVEAHGPGTPVGDPIEAGALGKQIGQARSKDEHPLWIGSLKGNFGHLEGAAGIAGFIKAALVTFHREIPPQVHFKNPNPAIDFQSLQIAVPTQITSLLGKRTGSSTKTAFLFSGQGGQWLGMGMALIDQEVAFWEFLDAFDEIFTALGGVSIRTEMSSCGGDLEKMNQTTIVQPAIAAIQIALARMLMSYGLTPDAIVGHSIGEVAAAHIAGALSLEEAVKVIYVRSQIQNKAAGTGSMLAAGISSKAAEQLLQRHHLGGVVEIAAHNGTEMTTLTGPTAELEQFSSVLEAQGSFARFVKVDVP